MMLVATSCLCGQPLWKIQLSGSVSMSGQFFLIVRAFGAKLPPSASSADAPQDALGRSSALQVSVAVPTLPQNSSYIRKL